MLTGGFVVTCVGGPGPLGYQETFLGDHHIDRAARQTFRELGIEPMTYAFALNGNDERQHSSPGFRISVATICKDKYFTYDYYHTSLDDLSFVTTGQIVHTLKIYLKAVEILKQDEVPVSTNPHCEPRLGGKLLPSSAQPGAHPGRTAGQAPAGVRYGRRLPCEFSAWPTAATASWWTWHAARVRPLASCAAPRRATAMSRPRTVILVRARIGSTHLPGKMLKTLARRPPLAWILEGARAARLADQVVLCTSVGPENDALAEMADGLGVVVFRGSEDDMLGRFIAAGRLHQAV
ncbi:hypothetical protein DFAR_2810019 [Desulfarculales bacterium]